MVIEVIKYTARLRHRDDTETRIRSDQQLISGHALRVAEEQYMTRYGIELYMIQLTGR